jgi:PST family polysaccharide transporter
MRSPSKFAQGVVLFALAGYVSKLISFAYRVPYQNLAGDFGLYAYQTVYPFAAIVASLGIYAMPVVIAKIGVGAKGANQKLEVLWSSFYALLLLSITLVVTMWIFAPTLAMWLGDEQLAPALRVISLSYLLMPASAVLRGAFQSRDDLRPSAWSQVLENFVRVTVMLSLLWIGVRLGKDAYTLSQYAYGATLVGGVVAIAFLIYQARGLRIVKVRRVTFQHGLRLLLTTGLAVGFASLGILWMQLVDSFTIVNLMGGTYEAKVSKGVFDRGYPLVQFAILFATTIGMANVPTLVRHYRAGHLQKTTQGLRSMIRVTTAIAGAATVGLMGVMFFLNVALFEDGSGTRALVLLATSTFAASLAIASMTCLQAIDREWIAARSMIVAILAKGIVNVGLVPFYGIEGAAVGTSLGFLAMAFYNFRALDRSIPLGSFRSKHYKSLSKALVPMLLLVAVLNWVGQMWVDSRIAAFGWLIGMVCSGAVLYIWRLWSTRMLSLAEWEFIPFGGRLLDVLEKKEN